MTTRNVSLVSMQLRKSWLDALGGLPNVSVKNKEWRDLLEEDTRHSLMIEGYFVNKHELQDIILNKKEESNDGHKVLGYFDAAFFSYEFALQQYKMAEFTLSKSLIRQIHALMFRNDQRFAYTPGDWRKGDIVITGAQMQPPSYQHIDPLIEKLIAFINTSDVSPVRKAAITHAVFEQIHPFPDGNGRVGRILLNFILVAAGLPNIALRGESKEERKEYIASLEQMDGRIESVLHGKSPYTTLTQHPPIALEDLINKSLAVSLDTVISGRFTERTGEPLRTIERVAKATKKNISSFRVACSQKKVICQKIDGRLMTHPSLLKSPAETRA